MSGRVVKRARLASDADKAFLGVQVAASEPSAAGKPVRIALVGLGRAGHFHINSIKLLGPHVAVLAWAIDVDEKSRLKTAAETGCRHSARLEDALGDVDAVVVASTTDTHFSFIKQALSSKKPCFTEKPISHNPAEVTEILDLARSSEVPFIVGYQRRCDTNFRSLKDLVDKGTVGQVRLVRCVSRDNPLPPMEYLRTSGGIFHDMLSHDFDMIHFLTGQIPESVYSVGHCYNEEIKAMGDADIVIVTMSFASGLLATVDTSRVAAYGYDQRVEVFGEKGMLSVQNELSNTVKCATEMGHMAPPALFSFPQRYKHTYTTELSEFCGMIQQSPMATELDEVVMRHQPLEKVATAAELSWRLGRKILLSEVDSLRAHLPH